MCEKKYGKCTFAPFGCKFVGSFHALKKHEGERMPHHIEAMTVYVANVDLENKDLESQLHIALKTRDVLSIKVIELLDKTRKEKEVFQRIAKNIARDEEQLTKINDNLSRIYAKLGTQQNDLIVLQNHATLLTNKLILDRIMKMERKLQITKQQLIETDVNLLPCSDDGVLLWKINNYTKWKALCVTNKIVYIASQPFYSSLHGYKMCGRAYLNGYKENTGSYISLYLALMKGKYDEILQWPFKHRLTIMILDQEDSRNNLTDSLRSCFQQPKNKFNNNGIGFPKFTLQCNIENPNSNFIKNDTMFVKIVVECL